MYVFETVLEKQSSKRPMYRPVAYLREAIKILKFTSKVYTYF